MTRVDFDRLKTLVNLTVDLDVDVDATFSEFLREAGDGAEADADAFLGFLRHRELIGERAFVELHGQEDIELSDLAGLAHFSLDGDGGDPATPPPDPRSRYDLLGPVGEGAMGVVHVARDLDLRRKVAFKTMLRHGALQRRRFLHEVQITAQLDHPNVVPVYSIEADPSGHPAYAMKLVRGRTLQHILDEARALRDAGEPLPDELGLPARLDLFLKVCDALAYAHSKSVIHRDLKPENVMVGRFGEVFVMDWGIAKLIGPPAEDPVDDPVEEAPDAPDAHRRTRMGSIVGTPAYMSPEQANGQVDAMGVHSDVFSLGLVLHELVFLEPAYSGADVVAVLARAMAGRVDPPSTAGVAPELHAIVRRATAFEPADRYPDVVALEADLRRFLRGEETQALPDTPLRRARRWMMRHQRTTVLVVAAVVLASLLAAGWSSYRRQVELAEARLHSQAREQRISELLGAVSGRAQHIDNTFLWYEGMLEGIGATAVYALERGTPTEGPWYRASDYRDPATSPPDMAPSASYGKPVSATFPVYTVAPGVPRALWSPDLALLDGLRQTLRNVFLVGPNDPVPPASVAAEHERIVGAERSMRWAYVALDRSGLMYMFPGAMGWDDRYDPRTRPWYRDAVGQRGRVWGKPYVDLMGQGRLLSCVMPLFDRDGAFLGVAGIDLQFNALLQEHLKMPEQGGYEAAYLLSSADGQVMLQTTAENDPIVVPPTEQLDEGIDFGTFDNAAVLEGAREGRAGHVLAGEQLLVWAPVRHLGWTYVVALDAAALEGPASDEATPSGS